MTILRWTARATSLVSVVFVLAFSLGTAGFLQPAEVVGFALFPVGVVVGFVVAWRREGVGAAVSLVSLAAFYLWAVAQGGAIPRGPYFVIFSAPAFLFLATWLWQKLLERAVSAPSVRIS